MASHNHIAMQLRLQKETTPEKFCPYKACLYKTGGPLCPKHLARALKGGQECNTV